MPRGGRGLRLLLTLVLGAVIGVAALFLGRELRAGGRGPLSQLEEEIDGGNMEQYLESGDQKRALLRWAGDGAPRDRWSEVEPILSERCVSCHNGVTMPNLVPLDEYEPAARSAVPRPLLARKIEWGTMERYLESEEEKEKLLRWIEQGAIESGWPLVQPILNERCVSCHNPETGVPGLVALDRLEPVARIATLAPRERRGWLIAAPAGALLAAALGIYRLWT